MRRYAFTGPSVLAFEQFEFVENMVKRLNPAPSELTTGGASGTDSICLTAGLQFWPAAKHRIVIPAAPWNEGLAEHFPTGDTGLTYDFEVIKMLPVHAGTDAELRRKAYRERNDRMLDHADELIAFVRVGSFYRSGEWMTINLAAKRKVPIVMYLLP